MKDKTCIILIDGSNFYFKLKDLSMHNLLEFNFAGFAKSICGNRKIVGATYYVGKVRTSGSERLKKMQAKQQKLLFSWLSSQVRWENA